MLIKLFVLVLFIFNECSFGDILSNTSVCDSNECSTTVNTIDINYSTPFEKSIIQSNNTEKTEESLIKSFTKDIEYIQNYDENNAKNVQNNIIKSNPSEINEKIVEYGNDTIQNEVELIPNENEEEITSTTSTAAITTTTQPSTTTISSKTENNVNTTKRLGNEICLCDIKVNECDINCCCDEDCTPNMKKVFNSCKDFKYTQSHNYCFSSSSMFKINLEHRTSADGMFCIVKNNYKTKSPRQYGNIIENATLFKKRISQKNLFTYSVNDLKEPILQYRSYKIGDYVWAVGYKILPFGVPKQDVNTHCNSVKNIHYLNDYSTQCLHSIPASRSQCERTKNLGMNDFVKDVKIVKSPININESKFSNIGKVCENGTCVNISSYVCDKESNIPECKKSQLRKTIWDRDKCLNVVSSIEYRIYHNGTDGIKEVRAYFTLANFDKYNSHSLFQQKVRVKFLWSDTADPLFERSGNPGYIIGKPIMSGRKVFSNNDTTPLKKEAIELSYNKEDWVTVSGTKNGLCTRLRTPVTFGENLRHTCSVDLSRYEKSKKMCVDIQEGVFKYLLGDDFNDIKGTNRFNKYVATYGNSKVEETGDWVQVLIDIVPVISSQVGYVSYYDSVICKDVVSDLNIDVAYTKIGSFDRPQNKILGVRYYFGSPGSVVYSNYTGYYKSSQMLRITTSVRFIDLSLRPTREFAETPGFEAKLPHDFFYPFFSKSTSIHQNWVLILVIVCFSWLF